MTSNYEITLDVVLEEVSPVFWIKEEIEEDVLEKIENLKQKKLIYTIDKSVEETEGIPDIHEERKITLDTLKNFSEEEFEKFKADLRQSILEIMKS